MRSGRWIGAGVMAVAMAFQPGAAAAAQGTTQAAAADQRALVDEVRGIIRANYVVASTRPAIDAKLAKGLASGRYAVAEPAELAARINQDLRAAANDPHLMIMHDPGNAAAMAGAQSDERMEGPHFEAMARSRNHGVSELRLLDGNIRYLKLDGFAWTGAASATALDTAMAFLRDGDAVVIDIRHNGGGSPEAVRYLTSHFMEGDRLLVTFHMGAEGETTRSVTLAELSGRMVGKPLFVLTSGRTASAAEEFAGHVSGFELGELVGETTMGAAFRNSLYPVAGRYVLSVSVGRPELASTGGDWEGKGIAPTVEIAADKALEMAQARARRALAASAAPGERTRHLWAAELIEARLAPMTPSRPLEAYAGQYGERRIAVEDGRLVYRRGHGPKTALIALGPDLFAIEADPSTRLNFGSADAFDLLRADGSRSTQTRTEASASD